MLNGSISPGAGIIFLAAIIGANIYSARRYGLVPKAKHLRDPRGVPYAAFWNFLSEKKWTDEGIEFHRQYLFFLVKMGAVLAAIWVILDVLT